jgi:membrane protein YdbS with pleckstrin-like domain
MHPALLLLIIPIGIEIFHLSRIPRKNWKYSLIPMVSVIVIGLVVILVVKFGKGY